MKTMMFLVLCGAVILPSAVPAEEVVYVVNGYCHSIPQPEWSTVMMLRGSDMSILRTVELPAKDAHSIAITPDGSQLWVTCSNGYRTFVVDAESFQVIQQYDHTPSGARPMGVAVKPDGLEAFVGMRDVNALSRYDTETYERFTFGVGAEIEPHFILFTPDGARVCVIDQNAREVRIMRTSDFAIERRLVLNDHGGLGDAALSPDGRMLYVCNMDANRIERIVVAPPYPLLPPTPLSTLPYMKPRGIAISPDGNYLFIGHYLGADSKVTMWEIDPRGLCAIADIPMNGRRVVANADCSRIYVTEHSDDKCFAYRVSTAEESMFHDATADLNTIPGQKASPIGIAVGDWEPHPSNYINLSVMPGYLEAGDAGALNYTCDFSAWNYRDTPVDIYLAVIRDPVAVNRPSSVEDALAGSEVWFYGSGMSNAYTGALREPTWSGVRFPPTALSGTLPFTSLGGWDGHWVYAVAFVRAGVGPVRTDGIPVENSNIFRLP